MYNTVEILFAGPPGSGKSLLSGRIKNLLKSEGFNVVEGGLDDRLKVHNAVDTVRDNINAQS